MMLQWFTYFMFRFVILNFDLKTPGRTDDEDEMEATILEGLGGEANIKELDYCATRIRTEIVDYTMIDEKKIKQAGTFRCVCLFDQRSTLFYFLKFLKTYGKFLHIFEP